MGRGNPYVYVRARVVAFGALRQAVRLKVRINLRQSKRGAQTAAIAKLPFFRVSSPKR